jgi:hypothetical protein
MPLFITPMMKAPTTAPGTFSNASGAEAPPDENGRDHVQLKANARLGNFRWAGSRSLFSRGNCRAAAFPREGKGFLRLNCRKLPGGNFRKDVIIA